MKAEILKKAILQYAMQGKLIEQDQNDEPASILLERIKAEKEQLIKDGKIKKEKPLPPITEDEIPYELPKGWEWCRLGELSIINGGYAFKSQEYINTGIRVVRISDFDEKGFKKDKIVYYKENEKYDDFILGNNDILLAMTGGTVGKSYYVENLQEKMYVNQRVADIKISIIVNSKYINYLILSPLTQDKITSCKKSTNDNISMQDIKEFYVPLPPLAEQERIVEKLEQILPLIEEYGKNEEKLSKLNSALPEKIKQSILQHAVQGKLVPQNPDDESASELLKSIKAEKEQLIKDGKIKKEKPLPPITEDEIPFQIPNSWEWCRVNDIGVYKKGPFGSALTKKIFVPKGTDTVKVYEQKNAIQKDCTLGEYYISKEYYEKSMKGFTVSSGDVIVSCAGTIGETYVMPKDIELGIINQALMRMTITKEIDLKYFLMYFDIILKRDSKTYSKGSAIKNIPPFEIFKPMLVPLPPLAEQQRIVTKVEELLAVVDNLKG